jgi:hypothetical protein
MNLIQIKYTCIPFIICKKTYIYNCLREWFLRNDGKISNAYYHGNIQCVKKIHTSFFPSSVTVPVTVNLTESHINKLHSSGCSHV